MTGVVLVNPRTRFFLADGTPAALGWLTVYQAGTTTFATTYQDKAQSTENTNPIHLDANGECLLWGDSASTYKFLLQDSELATVSGYPVDNIPGAADVGAAAVAAAAAAAPYVTAAQLAETNAETAQAAAEVARDAALAATKIYATTVAGLAAVANGEYFYVPSATESESLILYKDNAGVAEEVKRLSSASVFDLGTKSVVLFGADDSEGYIATPANTDLGYAYSFTLAECDSIAIYGDSYTDATYVLQDKAWVSVVSNLGPWRWRNMGRSGFTSTIHNEMVVDGVYENAGIFDYNVYRGSPHSARFAKYALLMSWTNDLSAGTATDWLKAAQHLTDVWRANGATPVVVSESRDFADTTNFQAVVMGNFARTNGLEFIDCQQMNRELQVKNGPFTDGSHPGTRTGPAIYGVPMLRWMEKLPRPQRSIKVYDVRETVTVGSLADLVFRDEYQLAQRFKEISLSHVYINVGPETFEERNQWNYNGTGAAPTPNTIDMLDQYQLLQGGSDILLEEYALIRVALPATARGLMGAALSVGTDATAVYVFDRHANNTQGTFTPTGAWTAATLDSGAIPLDQATLARCMVDNELFILLFKAGGVTVARPEMHYSPVAGAQAPQKLIRDYKVTGAELLTTQGCASLTGWTQTASPVVVTPFDLVYGGPRAPGLSTTITGAIEVTSANMIAQSAAVTASRDNLTCWRVRVWARYWPKVFLKNASAGYGFPAGEIIERTTSTFPTDSLITTETFDWRLLKLEANVTAAASSTFTAYEFQEKPVGLYWMPIDFYVSTLSGVLPGYFNFRLSSTDGTVQIGKVSLQEVAEYEHRC
jgi:hypothetical protein